MSGIIEGPSLGAPPTTGSCNGYIDNDYTINLECKTSEQQREPEVNCGFVPFRFHLNGAVNIREQTTSKAYKSFLGDPKS